MKKTIPIVVAAAMVCAMFAIVFVTTDVDATDAGLYLNGELVSGTSSGEGWSYNADSKTLTLSGANFTTAHTETGGYTMSAPLYYGNEDTLTIQLTGNNTITGLGTGDDNCGIYVRGSLVITGTGSLNVSNVSYDEAIVAVNFLTISGGTITCASAPGYEVHVANTTAENGFLMTGGTLHLAGNGNMDINGGAGIKITGGLIESEGGVLAAIGGSGIDGPFEISGGKVIIHNAVADGNLAFGSNGSGGSSPLMIIHDAPLDNVVQDGNALKSIAAGEASFGWASSTKTITFDANGGTCATATAETGVDGKLTSLPSATRDGYTFDGWYTGATSGDKISTSTVFDSNTTVYAHWTATPAPTPDPDPSGGDSKKGDNLGLIIGGVVAGVVAVAAIGAFIFFKKH